MDKVNPAAIIFMLFVCLSGHLFLPTSFGWAWGLWASSGFLLMAHLLGAREMS